jgi:hypothetical protein
MGAFQSLLIFFDGYFVMIVRQSEYEIASPWRLGNNSMKPTGSGLCVSNPGLPDGMFSNQKSKFG